MTDESEETGATSSTSGPHVHRIYAVEVSGAQGVQLGEHSIQLQTFTPESVVLASAVVIFSKAFLETLGQRVGDGVANLPKQLGDIVRKRIGRKNRSDEIVIGVEGNAAASVVITEDLPDEARLALLDLDVTAEELRGKLLRWDSSAGTWLPSAAIEVEPKTSPE